MRTTGNGRPSGRFDRVPPSVRHLWSLLYRAVRRHAVSVDRLDREVRTLRLEHYSYGLRTDGLVEQVERLTAAVDALARALDQLRNGSAHRSRGLDEQLADLASMLGDALRVSDEREGRVLVLRLRTDDLTTRVEALERRLGARPTDVEEDELRAES